MKGHSILLGGVTLASALVGFACWPDAPVGPAVSSPEECAVYAAALAPGSAADGLYTMMEDGKGGYDISCDWVALGVVPPKLIGLPSADCKAAAARHQKDADAICETAGGWRVTGRRVAVES
jgi:hypothetical protein